MTESGTGELSVQERLANAAITLFHERGYDAASVNDVVELAGLTKGSFYHYYKSKSDCLRQLHKSFIESELERLEAAVASSADPMEAIHGIVTSFLYGVQEFHSLNRIFDQEWRQVEGEGFGEIREKRDRIAEIVTEQISAGMDAGVFARHESPNVLGLAIIGMCGWAHRWFRPDGPLTYQALADTWSQMILNGLCAGTLDALPATGRE